MKTKFTVDYFIEKLSAIPEHLWLVRNYGDNVHGCVNNFLQRGGGNDFHEMQQIFSAHPELFDKELMGCLWSGQKVNNGDDSHYQQPTPKQRILAALRDIKAIQEKESPDYTIKLSVSSGEIMEHLTEAKLQLS